MRDFLDAPRRHPGGVLLTHVPFLVFWIAFAVRDVADGRINTRGGPVTAAADPQAYYLVAASIVAVAVFTALRIAQAALILADKHQ